MVDDIFFQIEISETIIFNFHWHPRWNKLSAGIIIVIPLLTSFICLSEIKFHLFLFKGKIWIAEHNVDADDDDDDDAWWRSELCEIGMFGLGVEGKRQSRSFIISEYPYRWFCQSKRI
jgi:hypothetical protein